MKNFLKGRSIQLLTGLMVASMALVSACGDDDSEPAVEPLLGIWEISSATLAADVSATNALGDDLLLPEGTDLTAVIATSFLANIECTNPTAKAIELAEGNDILYVCTLEEKSQAAGSWSLNSDRSGLDLRITIDGQIVALNLVNLVETSSTMGGLVNSIPLPPLLLAAVEPGFATVQQAAIPVSLNMSFRKL
ncbi:MAG: hypothetical protein RIF33_23500 [Cyclobacteriaceae bacterium]